MRPVRRIAVLLVAAALIAACGGTGRVRSVDLGRSGNTVVFGGDLYAWVLSGGIVVFDPVNVRDKSTLTKPKQHPQGFDHVLLSGIFTLRNGERTDHNPGRVIRR